jgi:RimJ/RimL family protein N-acetyltransferase
MVQGKLVRLRAVEPEDAERAYRWINDREVTQFLMARYPYSLVAERDWAANAAKPNEFGEARFAIETLDGVHIGLCGLHRGRPEDRLADLGIMIGEKDYRSQGYGTDAMLTLLRVAFYQMNLNKVTLGVFEINPRALAVYKKCRFVEEGRGREEYYQDGRYIDVLRMGVLRREFEALHGPANASAHPSRTSGRAEEMSVNSQAGA